MLQQCATFSLALLPLCFCLESIWFSKTLFLILILSIISLLQDQIDAAVKALLALKAEYKQKTGHDYKPGNPPAASPFSPSPPSTLSFNGLASSSPLDSKTLFNKVAEQGEVVRRLKAEKVSKVYLCACVHCLGEKTLMGTSK